MTKTTWIDSEEKFLEHFGADVHAPSMTPEQILEFASEKTPALYVRRVSPLPTLNSGEWFSFDVEPKPRYIFGASWEEGRWVIKELFEEFDEWLCVRSDRRYCPSFWTPATDDNRFLVK